LTSGPFVVAERNQMMPTNSRMLPSVIGLDAGAA
jgi:hypothetical protein